MPLQIQFPSYGRAMSIFSDIKGSFELPIISLGSWLGGHVFLTSNILSFEEVPFTAPFRPLPHFSCAPFSSNWNLCEREYIRQRVSSRTINCVDHKPVLLQLELSKLTGADDTFCLGLTSFANRYFFYAQ